jgi:hypothetical protein
MSSRWQALIRQDDGPDRVPGGGHGLLPEARDPRFVPAGLPGSPPLHSPATTEGPVLPERSLRLELSELVRCGDGDDDGDDDGADSSSASFLLGRGRAEGKQGSEHPNIWKGLRSGARENGSMLSMWSRS